MRAVMLKCVVSIKKKIVAEINKINSLFLNTQLYRKEDIVKYMHVHWVGKYICVCNEKKAKKMLHSKQKEYIHRYRHGAWKILFHEIIIAISNKSIVQMATEGATVIMFNYYGNRIEFFLNDGIVRTKGNADKYLLLKRNQYFDYFESPIIKVEGEYIYESQIKYVYNSITYRDIYIKILEKYALYIKSVTISEEQTLLGMTSNLQNITFPEKYIIKCNIPLIFLHGDMHDENCLMTDQRKIYVIDYEHGGKYPFFFDILTFAIMRFVSHNDESLLINILAKGTLENTIITSVYNYLNLDASFLLLVCSMVYSFAIYVDRALEQSTTKKEKLLWKKCWERFLDFCDELDYEEN